MRAWECFSLITKWLNSVPNAKRANVVLIVVQIGRDESRAFSLSIFFDVFYLETLLRALWRVLPGQCGNVHARQLLPHDPTTGRGRDKASETKRVRCAAVPATNSKPANLDEIHGDADMHFGTAAALQQHTAKVLAAAYHAHPERFKGKLPAPPELPTIVGINLPQSTRTDKEKISDTTKPTQQMLTNFSTQVSQRH